MCQPKYTLVVIVPNVMEDLKRGGFYWMIEAKDLFQRRLLGAGPSGRGPKRGGKSAVRRSERIYGDDLRGVWR